MALITVDLDSLSGEDITRVQNCWFPLVKSDSITQASEVDSASLKAYFDNLVNTKIKEEEEKTYKDSFNYTPPTL